MTSRQKVFDFMQEAGTLFIATEDGKKPKVRPIGFKMMVDEQIYFVTGKNKDFSAQMLRNSNVEIACCVGPEFLRYYGRVEFDEDVDKTLYKEALKVMPQLEELMNEETGEAQIFHISKATAEFHKMMKLDQTYNFLD